MIRAASLKPATRSLPPETLVLDQVAINKFKPQPVDANPSSPQRAAEIVNELTHGPVTVTGPNPHWCIQAIANGSAGHVHIEILDPVFWKNGPALPDHHLTVAGELGFKPTEGMWMLQIPFRDEEPDLEETARVMDTFMKQAWR